MSDQLNHAELIAGVKQLPPKGRVAFALGISELAIECIPETGSVRSLAEKAVDECWLWVAGQPVSPDSLTEFVDGPQEKDFSRFSLDGDEYGSLAAILTIISGISYAAYAAYNQEGIRTRPEPISETTEEILDYLIEQAALLPAFSDRRATDLLARVRQSVKFRGLLDPPVLRSEIVVLRPYNIAVLLERVNALPIRARVAFAVAVGECTLDAISPDPEGQRLGRAALDDCWRWLGGEEISGDQLAEYVEGSPEKEISDRQLNWKEGPVQSAIVAITAGISFAVHHAYEAEGNRLRSAPIWESGEHTLEEVVEHALRAASSLNRMLPAIIGRLEKLSTRISRDALGPLVLRERVVGS